jgi:sec-independent protein translocase protein TatB
MGSPPPILQANISMADSLLLMVIALVVFGPRRLPLIGRQIGKLMYEFRKASNDFKFQMEEELRTSEEADRRKREEAERQQRLAFAAQSAPGQDAAVQNSVVAAGTETQPSDAASSSSPAGSDAAAAESRPEESYPRILPPSTGETVAAARPNTAVTESSSDNRAETAPAPALERIPPETESPSDESRDVTEQASHHG